MSNNANQFDIAFADPTIRPVSMHVLQGVMTPASTNAAATTAATDYLFTWSGGTTPNHVLLQNNTGAALNYDFDTPATAGSLTLASGQAVFLDVPVTVLHLLTAAGQNVNGSAAANIVVRAWS